MLTVQGVYEKGTVQIKESIPDLKESIKEKNKAIDDLLGLCEGNTLTLDDIKRERLSRQCLYI
jgi:hypothetical protein